MAKNLGMNDTFVDYGTTSDAVSYQVRALNRFRDAFVKAIEDHFGSDADEFLYEYGLKAKYEFTASISIVDLDFDDAQDIQSMFESWLSDLESEYNNYYIDASDSIDEQ